MDMKEEVVPERHRRKEFDEGNSILHYKYYH